MQIRFILLFFLCTAVSIAYSMNDLTPSIVGIPPKIKVIAPIPRGIRVVPPPSQGVRAPVPTKIKLLAPQIWRSARPSVLIPYGPKWLSPIYLNDSAHLSVTHNIKSDPYRSKVVPVAAAKFIISTITPTYW